MGRVARAGSSNSGKAGTKNIGITRTKRRKRKDLEKLHRNVLEAKRNSRLRGPQKKKKKTTLEKVLNNFANKRQETEEICQDVAQKKDKTKKSKTICARLLPETIFGIYQNGTKGHEISRANKKLDKINEARLQGDVLKLLNGDETNPKFSWNGDEKLAENGKGSKALSSDESDYAGSIEGRVSRTKTPILSKTKRVKQINGENKKINSIEEGELGPKKSEQSLQFLQRENNCKRRLFEPNEDLTDSNRLGNATDSSDFVMGEIRFSPFPDNARDVLPPEDCFRKKKDVESKEVETRKKSDKKLMPIETKIDANFWGWAPTIYYERLCAMVCRENFENNWREQPSGSDPLLKIRSTLREFYRNACEDSRSGQKTVIAKGNKRREQTLSKVGVPLKDSSLPSTGEIQACITDSEVDQESSDSGMTKVGSWRPKYSGRISNPINSSVVPKTNEIFESKIHNRESQLADKISQLNNEQNNHCEKASNTIEKTIHSVALFLEKLRENNPLNGKSNIFEGKADARVSGQGQHSPDDSTQNHPRNLNFDINQRKLVRRNTKHVPTILRRSNSRCGALEGVDEKHQPLPLNNWLVNGPKRFTRTFAALPHHSQLKSNDSDYVQTPSVVNQLSVINKPKADILKTKLNFMKAKYRPDTRSLSPEYQEFENLQKKHAKNVAKNRKEFARQFFANNETADHRELYPTDFAVRSQNPTLEYHREEDRKSRRFNFGTHDDSKEISLSQIEKGFPEDIRNFNSSNRHENPRCHMQTKLSFEFPRPEIPKNFDARERRTFTNEMANLSSQRISRENSEETFIRPQYLAEDSKISTGRSRVSSLVSASRCGNEIQFVPEAYVEHVPIPSETKNEIKNRSFKPLPSYHANTLSVDRLAMNEAAGCAQHCRGVALRQRIRKPVVVFRPIQETRQHQEICDSRYRLTDNAEGTINDAVRNFRVLTFDDNNINQSASQHQPPEIYDLRYHSQQKQQQSLSQSHCHQQLLNNRHTKDFDNQPTKYLAFDGSDGTNPRRLPIFVNSDDNKVTNGSAAFYNHDVEPTKLFNVLETPENPEIMCLSCHDSKNPKPHATRVKCCGQQQQRPEMGHRRTSEVTLMLPCSASLCQQAPTNNPETTAAPHGPTSIKDIPRVVYSMTACKTLAPVEMTYQLKPLLYSQSRYDNEKLSKRVQLPDGRVGILVTENGSIDNSECLDSYADVGSRFERINMGNLNDRNCSGLANDRIYY